MTILAAVGAATAAAKGSRGSDDGVTVERVSDPGRLTLPTDDPPEEALPSQTPSGYFRGAISAPKRSHFPAKVNQLDAEGASLLEKRHFKEAIKVFTHSLQIMKGNPRALANRGKAYLELGDLDKGLDDLEDAVFSSPEMLPPLRATLSEAHLRRGRKLAAAGRSAEALDDFTASLRLNGRNAAAWTEAAGVAFQAGQFPLCLSHAERAVSVNSQFAPAYARKGECLAALGRAREAVKDLDSAIALDGNKAPYYASRAKLHWSLDEPAEALRDAQRAVDMDASLGDPLAPVIKESARKLRK